MPAGADRFLGKNTRNVLPLLSKYRDEWRSPTSASANRLDIDYPSGTISARYDYGDDLFAQIDGPQSAAPEPHYFLYDGLGSTRSLTNRQGAIEQTYSYKPFGEANGFDPSSENQLTRNLFTGEQFDAETGFYHFRARQYDPSVGRFTSFDPAEDYANRLHKYVYCANDPIHSVDLSGQMTSTEIIATTKISTTIGSIIGISAGTYVGYKENRGISGTIKLIGLYSLFFACVTYLIIAYPKFGINATVSALVSVVMSFSKYDLPSDYINAFIEAYFLSILSSSLGTVFGSLTKGIVGISFNLLKSFVVGVITAGILVLKWKLTDTTPEDPEEFRWRFGVAFGIGAVVGLLPLPDGIKDNAEARALYVSAESIWAKMRRTVFDRLLETIFDKLHGY